MVGKNLAAAISRILWYFVKSLLCILWIWYITKWKTDWKNSKGFELELATDPTWLSPTRLWPFFFSNGHNVWCLENPLESSWSCCLWVMFKRWQHICEYYTEAYDSTLQLCWTRDTTPIKKRSRSSDITPINRTVNESTFYELRYVISCLDYIDASTCFRCQCRCNNATV